MLQFVNVDGARRPSLSFLNVVEKPSLSCPQCYCASHALGGGCATCIVGPLMADVHASDGGEEDLQRERC